MLKLNEQMYSEKGNKSNKLFAYDSNGKVKTFFSAWEWKGTAIDHNPRTLIRFLACSL